MALYNAVLRPDGHSVQLVRKALETPSEDPLTIHEEIITELLDRESQLEELEGIKVGSVTLVGYIETGYPRKSGNCFELGTTDNFYNIVNFKYENFVKLMDDKVIEFPVKMLKLSSRQAVLNDSRISDDWYGTEFCMSCCPDNLLPLPQRLKNTRAVERGDTKVVRLTDTLSVRTINAKDTGKTIIAPYVSIIKDKVCQNTQK